MRLELQIMVKFYLHNIHIYGVSKYEITFFSELVFLSINNVQ